MDRKHERTHHGARIRVLLALAALAWAGTGCRDTIRVVPRGAVVIDVRTAGEFEEGAYPGALNIPVDEIAERAGELPPKETPIIVYCHSGLRAAWAKSTLLDLGYVDVKNAGTLEAMRALEAEATAAAEPAGP